MWGLWLLSSAFSAVKFVVHVSKPFLGEVTRIISFFSVVWVCIFDSCQVKDSLVITRALLKTGIESMSVLLEFLVSEQFVSMSESLIMILLDNFGHAMTLIKL